MHISAVTIGFICDLSKWDRPPKCIPSAVPACLAWGGANQTVTQLHL